jgi:SAM-dependent methyltransferase
MPPLLFAEIRSLEEMRDLATRWISPPLPLPAAGVTKWTVPGVCFVCSKPSLLQMDDIYAVEGADGVQYAWRERLVCDCCGLNNRQRAAVHMFEQACGPRADSRIWLTEQASHVYVCLKARFAGVTGSEFLAPDCVSGSVDERGLRHEDITASSFADEELDFVLTYDVLEHVPNADKAFRECHRVLAPRGCLMLSVPFMPYVQTSLRRAKLNESGEVEHLLPPQYHGDPVQPDKGVLCFEEFGWDILDRLKAAGFAEATALLCESAEYGYVGGVHIMFKATK